MAHLPIIAQVLCRRAVNYVQASSLSPRILIITRRISKLLSIILHFVLNNSGLDLLRRSRDADTLVGKTHLLCERAMRDPFGAVSSSGLFHHLVHLFQAQTLSLGNKEICKGEGEAAERTPKEEDFGAEIGIAWAGADKVGGDDRNDLQRY